MSQNINQIYIANPITTNASTDLMYFGQSPYGAGNDAAMTFANFNAQIVATGTTSALGYYAAAGNKISPIVTANNGVLITSNTGVPSYLANSGTAGFVLTANTGAPASWQAVSASGAITTIQGNSGTATPTSGTVSITGGATGLLTTGSGSTLSLSGTLAVANGGTGLATLTTYTLLAGGTTATGALQQVSAGTAGQMLQSGGASALPTWTTSTFPAVGGAAGNILISNGTNYIASTSLWPNTVGAVGTILRSNGTANAYTTSTFADTYAVSTLLYASASNVVSGLATANNASLVTGATGIPAWQVLTAGQILIGTTASAPAAATITAGTGVSVVSATGSITISATGSGMAWSTIAGTTQAAAVDNGYISGNAGQTTITLPATAAIGSTVAVEGLGAAGWILAANTGQTIKIGTGTTSSAGSLTSAAASDNVYVVCIVANTTWRVQTTNSAGLTIA